MKKIIIVLSLVVICSSILAQKEGGNIFIERSYWKVKPSISTIKKDIEKGHDIAALDGHMFDAVTWAILENNSMETLSFLLDQKGNEPNKLTHDQRTYVFWAAYKGQYKLMLDLIERGARMDILDQFGYSVMTFSAVTGQTDHRIYDLCQQYGEDITTAQNAKGADVLLMISPFLTNQHQLDYFLNKGLNLETKDSEGNNIFVYASGTGNKFMMNKALDAGLSPNANNGAAAYFAAKGTRFIKNDASIFRFLKKHNVSFDYTDEEGNNLMHILAMKNNFSNAIQFLKNEGVDLNTKNIDGHTPLLIAVEKGSLDGVEVLLSLGANPKIIDEKGNTVFHLAIDHSDVMDALLTLNNQAINQRNENGLIPLHVAAMKSDNLELLKKLLKNGADNSILTPFGESAYDLAKENELLNTSKDKLKFLKHEN